MNEKNIENLPWSSNDIYLEDNKKNVKAVCRDSMISKMIAEAVNYVNSSVYNTNSTIDAPIHETSNIQISSDTEYRNTDEGIDQKQNKNTNDMQEFLESAYTLYVLLPKAKIQITSIDTMFLEKAYHDFCQNLQKIMITHHIKIKEKIDAVSLS